MHNACVSEEQFIADGNIVEAREATEEDLLVVHTKRYLNRLKVTLFSLNTANPQYCISIIIVAWQSQSNLSTLFCFCS